MNIIDEFVLFILVIPFVLCSIYILYMYFKTEKMRRIMLNAVRQKEQRREIVLTIINALKKGIEK